MCNIFCVTILLIVVNCSYSSTFSQLRTIVSNAKWENVNRYLNQSEINNFLNQLEQAYPDLVKIETIGYEIERNITFVHISSDDNEKSTIFLDGNLYGRNWISPAIPLYIISQLVEIVENQNLIDKINWIVHLNLDVKDFGNLLGPREHWLGKNEFFLEEICDGRFAGPVEDDDYYLTESEVLTKYLMDAKNIDMYLTLHTLLCLKI